MKAAYFLVRTPNDSRHWVRMRLVRHASVQAGVQRMIEKQPSYAMINKTLETIWKELNPAE